MILVVAGETVTVAVLRMYHIVSVRRSWRQLIVVMLDASGRHGMVLIVSDDGTGP